MSTRPQSTPGVAVANGSIAAIEAGADHPADQLTWFDDFASGGVGLGSAVRHPRTGPPSLAHAGAELEHRTAELESANRELAAAVRLAEDARAEVAAVEAEQRALIEAMRDVILVLDGDGRYVKVPPTAPDLLYRPSQDLVGRLMHEVMPAKTADRFLAVNQARSPHLCPASSDAARQITEFASGTAYLEKPFSPQRLATRVRELLDMAPVSHEENR